MKQLEIILAEKLLKMGAVKVQLDTPFVWAVGWNAPIYNDDRQMLSLPAVRNFVKVELARTIMENLPQAEMVVGVATGAIAMGALVADLLDLPYAYVRETPKDHGLENLIEGNIKPGQRVVIVEDLLSTAKTCMRAVHAVRDAGGEVIAVVAIMNYEFPMGAKALKREKLPLFALTNYTAMIKAAVETGHIQQRDVATLQCWHDDPENWTPADLLVD